MRILFDHSLPFALAHGGFETQITRTMEALQRRGYDVDFVRWWDQGQPSDIIHFFGRPSPTYVRFAQAKGKKVVIGELHTGLGSRGSAARGTQKAIMRLAETVLPGSFTARMGWASYQMADAAVALTSWEAFLMKDVFGAPAGRVHVVPNGVEPEFLESFVGKELRRDGLICTATITERKRVVETAELAIKAGVPLRVVGAGYAETDPYYRRFLGLAESHPEIIRYDGAVTDRKQMAALYRASRGFVLLSTQESLSLSALEAAACGCPLLLSDLPWARHSFGSDANYLPLGADAQAPATLRDFYERAPDLPVPPPPANWDGIARQLAKIYELLH